MEPFNNMDVVILIGFAISMLVAFIRGFVREVLSIVGLALFIALVVSLTPLCLTWVTQYIASPILAQIVIFLVIMAVFYTIWIIGTDKLIAKIRTSTLSFMDRLFGLVFGLLRALLILGFLFLIVKIILPDELKRDVVKKSIFFAMAQSCSDVIEKALPEKFIEDTVKSFEDMNKVEKKSEDKKQDNNKDEDKEKTESNEKGLPSSLDQEQMNKMFEQLIKPEVKSDKKSSKEEDKKLKDENKGYDNKDTKNLDRLIDITAN